MKQLLQSLKDGTTEVADVPSPMGRRAHVLISTRRTLVSAGTERMLVDFGKASLLGKIRQQPDKVRMVIDKIRTDGLLPTIESVLNKLDLPLPMGYCNVGVVCNAGEGVTAFRDGDRVTSNGKHAEVVSVPMNLCAKVPGNVSDDEASFTVLASIALQGVRLAQPTLGESVVVTGLGLLGLITVQLLRANGCRVLGLDFDERRLALARKFGAETVNLASVADPVPAAMAFSKGRGIDAVIITAATKSNEPVRQAALMSRKRGRIILVGVTGLTLSRADFYEKELTFQVSCSYGPGRYDPVYEERGVDYPLGFVRWTEQRNFEAVLQLMSEGGLDVKSLISHRFAIADAEQAYELVAGSESSLGILLEYPGVTLTPAAHTVQLAVPSLPATAAPVATPSVGFIGAGNYATAILIPAFKRAGARLRTVVSNAGVTGLHAARKFGFQQTTTDIDAMLADDSIDAVVIATRHDSHAELVCRALAAGKHVFVEKPLALTHEELASVRQAWEAAVARGQRLVLTVGFNRRRAPQVVKIAKLLSGAPIAKAFVMTVNAGAIPAEHWTQSDGGGGRIIGEACHFIDLLRHLAGSRMVGHTVTWMKSPTQDTATISLSYADGSIGAIHYLANGSKAFPKERLEVFGAGAVLQLDNFRELRGFKWPGFKAMKLWRQDKGQKDFAAAFLDAIRTGAAPPIPFDELVEVAAVTIDLSKSA